MTFSVSPGNTCDSVQRATATWTAQSLNQTIGVSTAPYLGVRVLFSGMPIFDHLNQPALQGVTVNWVSSAGRPRTASQVFNNRYWLAYTTNTSASAQNNFVLVNDKNDHWSKLTGINASTLFTYGRQLYAGSSLSDGKIVLENSGTTDFGSPIALDWRSPDYELGSFNTVDLYDLGMEFMANGSAYSSTPALQYYVDQATTPYTLGTVNLNPGTPGLQYNSARFSQGTSPARAHTLSFEVLDTSVAPLTFYRSRLRFIPNDSP